MSHDSSQAVGWWDWLQYILCRIRLAIAVNQVAAIFVKDTPRQAWLHQIISADHPNSFIVFKLQMARILIVPAIQAGIGILWILLWALSATFLISQVPDGYTSKAGGM